MRETGILNRDISDVLSTLGHMDEVIVADAGFPIPLEVLSVDISLAENKPTVLEVLGELKKHFSVEKIIMAEETREVSPTRFEAIHEILGRELPVDLMTHAEFKHHSHNVKAVIRTGDFTAYSNVLLVSGAGNRWYVEKPEG